MAQIPVFICQPPMRYKMYLVNIFLNVEKSNLQELHTIRKIGRRFGTYAMNTKLS
jgi:hypothetical protein